MYVWTRPPSVAWSSRSLGCVDGAFPFPTPTRTCASSAVSRLHYTCHDKKVALRIEPNGDILDCTRDAAPMTNVRSQALADFIESPLCRDFIGRSESCNRCRDAGVIEASHIREGRPGALWNAVATLG